MKVTQIICVLSSMTIVSVKAQLGDFPACVQPCIFALIGNLQAGCDPRANPSCICVPETINPLTDCVATNCSGSDIENVLKSAETVCGSAVASSAQSVLAAATSTKPSTSSTSSPQSPTGTSVGTSNQVLKGLGIFVAATSFFVHL